ncbi:MAG: hypothetical protein AB7V42_11550 [Thermoleophilia bacterium]
MSRILRLAVVLAALAALASSSVASARSGWSAPVVLDEPRSGLGGAQVAADGSGDAIAVWTRGPSSSIAVAERPAGAPAFGPPSALAAGCAPGAPNCLVFNPRIAVNARGDAVALWQRGTGSSVVERTTIVVATRPAGRADWGDPVAVGEIAGTPTPAAVAIDAGGGVTVVWRGADFTMMAADAPSGAASFATVALGQGNGVPGLAVNASGAAAAAWIDARGTGVGQVLVAERPPGGAWGPPVPVSPSGRPPAAVVALDAAVALDDAGDALAAWTVADGSGATLAVARRPAGGAWGPPSELGGRWSYYGPPDIALAPSGDAVALWRAPEGVVAATAPATGPWSSPVRLSLPERPASADGSDGSRDPALAVAPDGSALAVWAGSRDATGSVTVMAARRPAGGAWEPRQPISVPAAPFLPVAALAGADDGVALWSESSGPDSRVRAAVLTAGPGFVLEPVVPDFAGLSAPARVPVNALARLRPSLRNTLDHTVVGVQRLTRGRWAAIAYARLTGPSLGGLLEVPVRLGGRGVHVLRIFSPVGGATPPVKVTVTRPARRRVAVGTAPVDVATGAGAAWVLSSEPDGTAAVRRLSGEGRRTFPPIPVGRGAAAIAHGAGALWVVGTDRRGGHLQRIDPIARRVTSTVPVPGSPQDVAVGAGGAWVASQECGAPLLLPCSGGTLLRFDPRDPAAPPARFTVAGLRVSSVAIGGGRIWLVGGGGDGSRDVRVATVDPSDGAVREVRSSAVPGLGVDAAELPAVGAAWTRGKGLRSGRYTAIARDGRSVWLARALAVRGGRGGFTLSVVRRDARTGRTIGRPLALGRSLAGARAMAVGSAALWLTLSDEGTLVRIPLRR